jgi:hypothetical protein
VGDPPQAETPEGVVMAFEILYFASFLVAATFFVLWGLWSIYE